MPQQIIRMSTTDSVPGEQRAPKRFEVAWIDNADSIQSACDSLRKWAFENGFEAIVGLRFLAIPIVHGRDVMVGSGSIHTNVNWTAYGTCVAY